jgi:2-polyprenyl-3-methyl-5-hydroxy-6-metoxy-1,4-benzoquinol methylase
VFGRIYATRAWGDDESASGPGSGIVRTARVREVIRDLVDELGVESLLDAGCGDYYWMRLAELPLREYVGVDVVPTLIKDLRRSFEKPGVRFVCADISRDRLPRADMVLCREVLMHFPDDDVMTALSNLKRTHARWFLTTTFVDRRVNEPIELGAWRPVNLEAPPFNLPPPLRTFEDIPLLDREQFLDKRIALWEFPTLL